MNIKIPTNKMNFQNDYCQEDLGTGKPTLFACRKGKYCHQMAQDCALFQGDTKCRTPAVLTSGSYDDYEAYCHSLGGRLPKMVQANEVAWIDDVWLALKSKSDNLIECSDDWSPAGCINAGNEFYWDGGPAEPNEPLAPNLPNGMAISGSGTCFRKLGGKIVNKDCNEDDLYKQCVFLMNVPNDKNSAGPADFNAGEALCSDPETPPSQTLMRLSDDQPALKCIGTKAKFECDAGGVNVRADDNAKNTIEAQCGPDLNYQYPDPWPVCVDRLDCPEPYIEEGVMAYDWETGSALTPEFSIEYSCIWPGKLLIPIQDLEAGLDRNVQASLTINCQLNGTYDTNMEEWTCTKPCPFPSVPDPEIMVQDWASNVTKPEIYDQNRHSCKDGRKLVSKLAFETGGQTNFLDEIMSSCQVTGWMNETIGSFTCTRGCDPPTNYTLVFTHDWDPSVGSDIATVVK